MKLAEPRTDAGTREILRDLGLDWIDATTHTQWITPPVAKELLKLNDNIRKLKPRQMRRIESDMSRGRWTRNGSTMVFDDAGKLIDGQHRLEACVRTGAGFWAIIVLRGVREGIDATQPRTLADIIGGEGASYAWSRAAAIRALFNRFEGREAFPIYHGAGYLVRSEAELAEFRSHTIDATKLDAAVDLVRTKGARMLNPTHVFVLGYILPDDLRREFAELVYATFGGETALIPGTAAHAWYRWTTQPKKVTKTTSYNMVRGRWIAMLKAWNAHAQSHPMKLLRVSVFEDEPQVFGEHVTEFPRRSRVPND